MLLVLMGLASEATAQCTISVSRGEGCEGTTVEFSGSYTGSGSVTSWIWYFGDGTSSNDPVTAKQNTASHLYGTPGTFSPRVTIILASGDSCVATLNTDITIFPKPVVDYTTLDPLVQCFEGNEFCFDEQVTVQPGGAPIASYFWTFGDGDTSTATNPCHTYTAQGNYTVTLQAVDTNGCTGIEEKLAHAELRDPINAEFRVTGTISCPTSTYTFFDLTNTTQNIISRTWILGDGTVLQDPTTPFSHTYTIDGIFHPMLIVETDVGCIDTFTVLTANVRNIAYHFDEFITDTVCLANSNVAFSHTPRPNAIYHEWNFGDPMSGDKNVNDLSWTPSHQFVGGPNHYHISLEIVEPNCRRDTTWCAAVQVLGPAAAIPTPPGTPPNNCLRPEPISMDLFKRAKYDDCFRQIMGMDTIQYWNVDTIAPYVASTENLYCNADTSGWSVASETCGPYTWTDSVPILIPTGSRTTYDSVTTIGPFNWVAMQDPIPANPVYTDFSGNCNPQTMHDTDLFVPNCAGPNWVRFTNNTVKYRIYSAIDDVPPGFPDTCKNPSYPWGSDSLLYLWSFGDGDACTSTVANPDVNCQFSTEQQPWHLFKDTGCYSVTMTATDTVVGCTHSTTVSIVQEPPDASWDENAYDYISWADQEVLPVDSPRRGLILDGAPCVGPNYKNRIQLDETLPSCNRQDYAIVFDSAASVAGQMCDRQIYDPVTDSYVPLSDTVLTLVHKNNVQDTVTFSFYGTAGTRQPTCPLDTLLQDYNIVNTQVVQAQQPTAYSWVPKMIIEMFLQNQWTWTSAGCKTVGLWIKTGECVDTFWYHNYKYILDLNPQLQILDNVTEQPVTEVCPPETVILTPTLQEQEGITKFLVNIYDQTGLGTPATFPRDSFFNVRDTFYQLCDTTAYTWDSTFTVPRKVYSNCTTFPALECPGGCAEETRTVADALALNPKMQVMDTLFDLNLQDTLRKEFTKPGRYFIASTVENLYGCSRTVSQELIVGHFNYLEAEDTVVCLGQPVNFHDSLGYFVRSPYIPQQFPDGVNWDYPVGATWPLGTYKNFFTDPVGARGGRTPAISEEIEYDFDGDGVVDFTGTDPSFTYTQPGSYDVTMFSRDSTGCRLERTITVHVVGIDAGIALQNAGDTLVYCSPQTITFLDDSEVLIGGSQYTGLDSIVNWSWTFGDNKGGVGTVPNPTHVFTNNGTYQVILEVENASGCVDRDTISITIVGPKPTFALAGPDSGCVDFTTEVMLTGDNVSFVEFLKGDGTTKAVSYWNDPNGPQGDTISLTYTNPGTYNIRVVAADSIFVPAIGGSIYCEASYPDSLNGVAVDTIQVTVLPTDEADFFISDTLICEGEQVTFIDESDADYTNYYWQFGDGEATDPLNDQTVVAHTYAAAGIYDVTYIPSGATCPDTAYGTVEVRALTVAMQVEDGQSVTSRTLINNSVGGEYFEWEIKDEAGNVLDTFTTFNQDPIPYDFDQHPFTEGATTFEVCLTAYSAQACVDSVCTTVTIEKELIIPNVFTPNGDGDNDFFEIQITGELEYELVIFNRWGEKVFESTDPAYMWNGTIMNDGADVPEGSYFFLFDYRLAGEEAKQEAGSITLLRDNQ